jgi:hypothetical protein
LPPLPLFFFSANIILLRKEVIYIITYFVTVWDHKEKRGRGDGASEDIQFYSYFNSLKKYFLNKNVYQNKLLV